jgi:HTH-type transcriptional regulator, sugar sensing transcriptional regulator
MKKEIENLMNIGFNNLEAEVYIYLLAHPPATAYKIGKDINKPTANVYKAIDSLSVMGAVLIEDNKNKLCKAVPSDEFMAHYKKELIERTSQAEILLKDITNDITDQNTYTIQSVSLVFERFKRMMDSCKKIAVIDAFPETLSCVIPIIEMASKRGVEVFVEAYQPVTIEGADVVNVNVGEQTLKHWNSQQLNVVVDGQEHLIALMSNDLKSVIQAVWSNNIYMSCILHAGALREHTIMKIQSGLNKKDFEKRTRSILSQQKFFYNSDIPGFEKLSRLK